MKKLLLLLVMCVTVTLSAGAQPYYYNKNLSNEQFVDQYYYYSTGVDTIVITDSNLQRQYYPGQSFKVKVRRNNTGNTVWVKVNSLPRVPLWYSYKPVWEDSTSQAHVIDTVGTARTAQRAMVDSLLRTNAIITIVGDTVGDDKFWWQSW